MTVPYTEVAIGVQDNVTVTPSLPKLGRSSCLTMVPRCCSPPPMPASPRSPPLHPPPTPASPRPHLSCQRRQHLRSFNLRKSPSVAPQLFSSFSFRPSFPKPGRTRPLTCKTSANHIQNWFYRCLSGRQPGSSRAYLCPIGSILTRH